MTDFSEKLNRIFSKEKVLTNEPMSEHTTFKAGGSASYFVSPSSYDEIKEVVDLCRETAVPYRVIGNGSNILVSDSGFDGVIIEIGKDLSDVTVTVDTISAQAGASLAKIASAALQASLTGFEFASGIPGTIGGAVIMNAGAYDGEMKQVIKSVKLLGPQGIIVQDAEELELSYRHSNVEERNLIVLEAELKLNHGDADSISAYMKELNQRRAEKQPLEYPSAGSTFKRPKDNFAGKLISDAGLKGLTEGGAMISEKHAGFVINAGDATANDIYTLTEKVISEVEKKTGVRLEREIKLIGEF